MLVKNADSRLKIKHAALDLVVAIILSGGSLSIFPVKSHCVENIIKVRSQKNVLVTLFWWSSGGESV